MDLQIGQRIFNGGDMANIEHFGTITAIKNDKWGCHVKIVPDHYAERENYTIDSCLFSKEYKGNGLTRIVTYESWLKWRKQQIEKLNNFIKNR